MKKTGAIEIYNVAGIKVATCKNNKDADKKIIALKQQDTRTIILEHKSRVRGNDKI